MDGLKRAACVLAVALVLGMAMDSAALASKSSLEAYLDSYAKMGKKVAAWAKSQTAVVSAQASSISAWAKAQSTLSGAQVAAIKSAAAVKATSAATRQTLEQVRGQTLDNNLKTVQKFYTKRKLSEGHRALNVRKRPGKEDLIRYAKASASRLSPNYQVQAAEGKVRWPRTLRGEEFLEYRVRVDNLFAGGGGSSPRQAQEALMQMRSELQSQVRQMSPIEYIAARKFINALALASQSPKPAQAAASQ